MYLQEAIEGIENIKSDFVMALCIGKKELEKINADKVEVWCSSFNDGGDDYNEFRFFKNDKKTPVHVIKQRGY